MFGSSQPSIKSLNEENSARIIDYKEKELTRIYEIRGWDVMARRVEKVQRSDDGPFLLHPLRNGGRNMTECGRTARGERVAMPPNRGYASAPRISSLLSCLQQNLAMLLCNSGTAM